MNEYMQHHMDYNNYLILHEIIISYNNDTCTVEYGYSKSPKKTFVEKIFELTNGHDKSRITDIECNYMFFNVWVNYDIKSEKFVKECHNYYRTQISQIN